MRNKEKIQALAVHKALMIFQFKNKFVGGAYVADCDLLESHILFEIEARRVTRLTDLTNCLGIHKSVLARRIASLLKRCYVEARLDQDDARSTNLTLSAIGEKILKAIDDVANPLMKEHCSSLTLTEQKRLSSLINQFAYSYDLPPSKKRPRDLGLRSEMRTLARAMGVIGQSFMGSSVSSTTWHILIAIFHCRDQLLIKDIALLTELSHAATSKALKILEQQGLLGKHKGVDGRSSELSITTQGKGILKQIDSAATSRIVHGMRGFGEKDRSDFTEFILRLAFGSPTQSSISLGRGGILEMDSDEVTRGALRSFAVKQIATMPSYDHPESLFHIQNQCFHVKTDFGIVAAAELARRGEDVQLVSFFSSPNKSHPFLSFQVFVALLWHMNRAKRVRTFQVSDFPHIKQAVEDAVMVLATQNICLQLK